MLEFSSTLLPAPSPYLQEKPEENNTRNHHSLSHHTLRKMKTFEPDLDSIVMNQRAKYLRQGH